MKLKYLSTTALVGFATFLTNPFASRAESGDLDGVGGYDAVNGGTNSGGDSGFGGMSGQDVSSVNTESSVGNFFKGFTPINNEQMQSGSYLAQPIVDFLGVLSGALMTVVIAWTAVQTVVDLLYWSMPPLRGLLSKGSQPQQASGGMGMGGMGGYGMGGGMGGGQQQQSSKLPTCVSDDMVQAMEMSQPHQQGGMGGMGMGGMGGMMGGQQQQQSPKHTLLTYAKKRTFSLILLGVCMVVLFSSILVDTGINIGAFLSKILGIINDGIVSKT